MTERNNVLFLTGLLSSLYMSTAARSPNEILLQHRPKEVLRVSIKITRIYCIPNVVSKPHADILLHKLKSRIYSIALLNSYPFDDLSGMFHNILEYIGLSEPF